MKAPPKHIDAIVCDVDGCLSPEAIAPANLAALGQIRELAQSKGVPLTLCTGRPMPFTDAIARVVGALSLPSVCEGGVWLLDPKDYTWSMDERITSQHIAAVQACRAWIGGRFKGVWFEEGKTAAVTVFHEDGAAELKSRIQPEIEREIADRGWPLRCSMTWTCINVELDFVSKATGLDRFLAKTGLDPANLIGVGDTTSDLAIRERVAWFACPANAAAELKPHADLVAQMEEAAGILEILQHVLR